MVGPPLGGCLYQYLGFTWAIIPVPFMCLGETLDSDVFTVTTTSLTGRLLFVGLMMCIPCVGLMEPADSRGDYEIVSQEDGASVPVEDSIPAVDGSTKQGWRDCLTLEVGMMTLVAVFHAACQSFCGEDALFAAIVVSRLRTSLSLLDMTLAKHLYLAMGSNAAVSGSVFMVEPIMYRFLSYP